MNRNLTKSNLIGRLENSRFFFSIRKARSAVSVILACEARELHTPYASLPIIPRRFYTPSLQNRRISEASAMHERAGKAREVRERSSPRTQLAIRARLAFASVRLKHAKHYARSAGY